MAENEKTVASTETAPRARKNFSGKAKGDKREPRERREREASDIEKRIVCVRRVQKVVKGGRTLRFSALVVVGDGKGKVGLGIGKSKDVSSAIEKATTIAKRSMKLIPIVNGTIPHEIIGRFSSTKMLMLPAPEGTGVIAGGSARSVLELAGVKNIVTKKHGSSNKINCVKATMEGLLSLRTKEEIARRRGKSPEEI